MVYLVMFVFVLQSFFSSDISRIFLFDIFPISLIPISSTRVYAMYPAFSLCSLVPWSSGLFRGDNAVLFVATSHHGFIISSTHSHLSM
ncbi:hypothetical protein BJ165DRAFT_380128 [Panaeolus papilionaceus]|nr:hypothetical protein BJ165DRAFT_380128 [Panaeolus papilionaceus]